MGFHLAKYFIDFFSNLLGRQIIALNSFSVFSLDPCFSTGLEEVSRSPHFPASGAESIAAGWKVEEEQTIERVPVLKHGAKYV